MDAKDWKFFKVTGALAVLACVVGALLGHYFGFWYQLGFIIAVLIPTVIYGVYMMGDERYVSKEEDHS
jgi:hypothetical protein